MTQTQQPQADAHFQGNAAWPGFDLAEMNREMESLRAEQRVAWTLEHFPGRVVLTSSFGAQSAVCLHLVTQQQPDISVVLVDTGYLFPETYQFIDELSERLALNLHIYRAQHSAAWQEARYGKLWEQGLEGIERYNWLNKVEPMQRALRERVADPRRVVGVVDDEDQLGGVLVVRVEVGLPVGREAVHADRSGARGSECRHPRLP